MERDIKIKMLIYALVSAVSFTYLVLPQNAGVSIPVFTIIQFICLWFILPKKKSLLTFIPIFILSLNSFIYQNKMWSFSNFIIMTMLYSVILLALNENFSFIKIEFKLLSSIFKTMFVPFKFLIIPFKWFGELNKGNTKLIVRIFIGISLSFPILCFLIVMLSSADSIFAHNVFEVFKDTFSLIKPNAILKTWGGLIAGIYLFGIAYMSYLVKEPQVENVKSSMNGDLVVLNIIMVSILTVYTAFVVIQFRYLFSGAELPYDLSYSDYARKGFFELLFLTAANIFMIILNVNLTKAKQGVWAKINECFCHYLCVLTIILLSSSWYRMWLYSYDDGLTRLRLLVFGFLIFECIGLLITFFYIRKQNFNIISIYLLIAFTYYAVLNVFPIDRVVARDQINRYLDEKTDWVGYVFTLSADATPEIERLLYIEDTRDEANEFIAYHDRRYKAIPARWQRWHLPPYSELYKNE